MAELKTKKTQASVKAFLDGAASGERRKECDVILKLMKDATKCEPKMWGASIVGFGTYSYKYPTGQTGDWPVTAFSPRKANLTLYVMPGFEGADALLAKLGKHKHGKSCLYLKNLGDVDMKILKQIVTAGVRHVKATYPTSL
jgi:hypothetical protein